MIRCMEYLYELRARLESIGCASITSQANFVAGVGRVSVTSGRKIMRGLPVERAVADAVAIGLRSAGIDVDARDICYGVRSEEQAT